MAFPLFSPDPFSHAETKGFLTEVGDLRRKQLTLECGILDNEAKIHRKRKLLERKKLHDEDGNVDDLNDAIAAIGGRTDFMKVGENRLIADSTSCEIGNLS